MLKKIFIISTIFLMLILVFFGIYIVAFKKTDDRAVISNKIDKEKVDIASVVSKKITNITSDSVIAATIGPDGETIRYYDGADGRAWTMTLRGTNRETLINETLGIPKKVKWSPDGNSAILTYDDKIIVYNFATGTQNKLRDGMDDVVWSTSGGRILYKYYDQNSKERTLNISNADGTNWKKLADLPFRYTTFVQMPSSILAAFWPTADANVSTQLFTTSTLNEGTPKEIFSGKNGADFLFSPDGKKVLVSYITEGGKKVHLGIMDSNGANFNDLMIPTIVQKVVWGRDSKTVYYAQPNNAQDSVLWPNDYLDKKFTTQDTFYKIDITTGKKDRIVELNDIKEKIDAFDLFLNSSENLLFFINRTNGLLYRIDM